jgi:hypothetical protein
MQKADFVEYYSFDGNRVDAGAILALASLDNGWLYLPDIRSVTLKFVYDKDQNKTLGIGLFNLPDNDHGNKQLTLPKRL